MSRFIWRKNPLASLSVYAGIALTLVGPVAAARALAWRPLETGTFPLVYLAGMAAMALSYGLYYAVRNGFEGAYWIFGIAFIFFYVTCLIWQTYIALVTARESKWGTRPSEHLDQGACDIPARMLRPGLPLPAPRVQTLAWPATSQAS